MLKSRGSRCWIMYLGGFYAIILLYAIGLYRDPLRKLYFVLTMFGSDSSNQKAGLVGQFTYSTSILPCLACTILQE